MASDWKAKLADLTKVEAIFFGILFFTLLAILDALIPQVDLFAAVFHWFEGLVGLVVQLIVATRGAINGAPTGG